MDLYISSQGKVISFENRVSTGNDCILCESVNTFTIDSTALCYFVEVGL